MFKHPIRDLLVLSLVGWYAKHRADKRGGWKNFFSRGPTRSAAR
jgi:hypothetical protein